ncbi:hypothetical protein [Candidatus Venteria ishoeyi]|uniref:Uncharacterized protein n=1 Tax=Candidatus Venteria ishoeyi TaxID=1899563 RepID=A0A1H6FDK4_9GAMM|nr:hypothetical protein [Candidatus Venteria ishoeyi]SEH08152.1 Uncharacterised protein [Candidatus Venteria ishoeyi]
MSYLKPILSFLIQYLLILAQTAWAQEQEILPLSESFSPLAELSAYNPLQQHSGTNLNEHTIHCTINRTEHDADFIDSIQLFIQSWQFGLEKNLGKRISES